MFLIILHFKKVKIRLGLSSPTHSLRLGLFHLMSGLRASEQIQDHPGWAQGSGVKWSFCHFVLRRDFESFSILIFVFHSNVQNNEVKLHLWLWVAACRSLYESEHQSSRLNWEILRNTLSHRKNSTHSRLKFKSLFLSDVLRACFLFVTAKDAKIPRNS